MKLEEAINYIKFCVEYSQDMWEGNGDEEDKKIFLEDTDEALELILNKLRKDIL